MTPETPETTETFTPLSFDRATKAFDELGWQYDANEKTQTLQTGFSGIGMQVKFLAPNVIVATTVAVDAVKADRFEELMAWARDYNLNNAYPSVSAFQDKENDLAALGVAYTMPGYWDYTEEQFRAHLTSAIDGVVNTCLAFLETFAPDVHQRVTQAQQQA